MLKPKLRQKLPILIAVIAVLVIIFGGYALWGRDNFKKKVDPETFAQAETRCGHKPVIGSKDGEGYHGKNAYHEPSTRNNDLLSEYDPANLDMSSYTDPEFFCSAGEAEAAGYAKHRCCGLMPLNSE